MSPRAYKASEQTKNNILQKAIELYNESGTASVSMSALAEALGMSAGNLQYHYKNKEEMIRAIYEVMYFDWQEIYTGMDESFNLDVLRVILGKNFDLTWKYRFFYREYAALLRHDKTLSKRFREIQEQRVSEQEALVNLVAKKNRIKLDPKETRNVVLIGWVLGNTWLSYIESTGRDVDKSALDEAVEMMLLHYKSYIFKEVK
ncbi:MAG: TetR/AcrR family transcriptional regulator [Anaerolineales bacterium]